MDNGLPEQVQLGQESEPQVLLILVGLPGSGKTTLAEALVHLSGSPEYTATRRRRWVRASQDDAPSGRRQECEATVRKALEAGSNVIVDRVDFDSSQRTHFISLAYNMPTRPLIYCLVLSASDTLLRHRLMARTGHPTITDFAMAMRVLDMMSKKLVPPTPAAREGFDRIYTLPDHRQPPEPTWSNEYVTQLLIDIERDGLPDHGPRIDFVSDQPNEMRPFASRAYRPPRNYNRWPQAYAPGDAAPGTSAPDSNINERQPRVFQTRNSYNPNKTRSD